MVTMLQKQSNSFEIREYPAFYGGDEAANKLVRRNTLPDA